MLATPDQWDTSDPPRCGARFNATRFFPRFCRKLGSNNDRGPRASGPKFKFKQTNERDSRNLPERAKGGAQHSPDESQKEVTFTRLIRGSAYRIPSSQGLSVVDWVKESVQSRVLEAKPIKPVHVFSFPCPFSFYIPFYHAVQHLSRPGQVSTFLIVTMIMAS